MDEDEIKALKDLKTALDRIPNSITPGIRDDHVISLQCQMKPSDEIQASVEGLHFLKVLLISCDHTKDPQPGVFPESFLRIPSLEVLGCGGFIRLPDGVGNLHDLKVLSVGPQTAYGESVLLPESLRALSKLEKFTLRQNKFTHLPALLVEIPSLIFLDVAENRVMDIPEDIGKLKNLQVLDLSHNEITAVQPEIGELKMLKNLRLNNNKITSLPSEICTLGNLGILDLSNNV
nr:leucine-rich repeat domain-containing protein [Candidatus Sigynarchaeota archaeon]